MHTKNVVESIYVLEFRPSFQANANENSRKFDKIRILLKLSHGNF